MRKSAQPNLATLYNWGARHAIDASNRIMLPADWRVAGAPVQFFVVVAPSEDRLVVCPPSVFEEFLSDLRAGIADKSQIPQLERELNARVRMVTLDRFGRLPVPPDLMARVGMEKQGQIVGRFSKFELWPCEKYDKAHPEQHQASEILSRKLETL